MREKAQGIVKNILPELSILVLIKHYKLIEWLERATIVDLSEIQRLIHARISDPENREQLLLEMKDADFQQRLFCWKVLSDEVQTDPDLIDNAIHDSAPEIRQWAARNLPHNEQFQKKICHLLSDKAVRVKYAALKAIPRDQWCDYQTVIEFAIYDDSRSIREYARFSLSKISDIKSYPELYKKMLNETERPNFGTIMGLAETGTKIDAEILRQFLKDDKKRIRAGVLLAFHKLNVENMEDFYIEGLKDTGKVCRACSSILSERLPTKTDRIFQIYKVGR